MKTGIGFFQQRSLAFVSLLIALGFGLILGTTVCDLSSQAARESSSQLVISPKSESGDETTTRTAIAEGFARVAERIAPAVVNINSQTVVQPPQRSGRGGIPEPFRDFFGEELFERFYGPMVPQTRRSLGSGFIVDSKGYILTNHHVVAPTEVRGIRRIADEIEIRLSTGETYPAEVVGVDPESDLAVLKIDADQPLHAARVGDSGALTVGDWVVAVGSPFGLEHTVTAGIVSATERVVETGIFGNYIQTDAAINPGNSGGPLVNLEGEVVGINTFIATSTGSFAGVGFAVPSTVFVNSYNQLISRGTIERGWLGVSMNAAPMTREMAEHFGIAGDDPTGIKDGDGVIVAQLIDEHGEPTDTGPAARAGIKEGDVIVKFGDREIESSYDLRSAVANTPPGETVKMTIVRGGQPQQVEVQLATRTLEKERRSESQGLSLDEQEEKVRPREIGVEFRTFSRSDAEQFGLEDEQGVLILAVQPGSLADDAGLRENQIITHVNSREVSTAREFKESVDNIPSGGGVVLRVVMADPNRQKVVMYTSFVKP